MKYSHLFAAAFVASSIAARESTSHLLRSCQRARDGNQPDNCNEWNRTGSERYGTSALVCHSRNPELSRASPSSFINTSRHPLGSDQSPSVCRRPRPLSSLSRQLDWFLSDRPYCVAVAGPTAGIHVGIRITSSIGLIAPTKLTRCRHRSHRNEEVSASPVCVRRHLRKR